MYILIAFIVFWFLTAFLSYYLFYLITFSVCSIGILVIFFWKIVWDGLYDFYRLRTNPSYKKKIAFNKERERNERIKRLRKLSQTQRWKTVVKEKLLSVFAWILIPCIFLGVPAGALAIGGNFLLDFPAYLFGKTATTTGYISDYDQISGRKSLSYTLIEIENEDYMLTHSEDFYIGDHVKIEYLPHTKIIREFEIVEDEQYSSDIPIAPVDLSLEDSPVVGSWEYSNEEVYISILLSETGLAHLGEHYGDEAIYYNGNWKYDEKEETIIFEVDEAKDLDWKQVEHPDSLELIIRSITDDAMEIEYLQKKLQFDRIW